MYNLIRKVKMLKRDRDVKKLVDSRIKEFKKLGKKSSEEIFKELCFCILTANFNAERSIKIQKEIENGFLYFSQKELSKKLKELGHRFPNTRAKYIVNARNYSRDLRDKIENAEDKRGWLVRNIKGLGYKEASHFLRNIGFEDFAIIDFHIIDLLVKEGLIKKPKTLTKRKYIEIENILRRISKKLGMSLGELDLYLWYIETGKVFK